MKFKYGAKKTLHGNLLEILGDPVMDLKETRKYSQEYSVYWNVEPEGYCYEKEVCNNKEIVGYNKNKY